MSRAKSKEIDFEVNLLPVISILAVCICFLLLTAVWVHVGTIDTAQAIGAETATSGNNPPSIVVQLDKDNSFDLQLKDVNTKNRNFSVRAERGQANWARVDALVAALQKQHPEIKTAVVLTRPQVKFGNTIRMVDTLKKSNIKDVGISPQ
ncbi:MAG: biopolymer transporter ExbD [Bdellovibrionaceae bacterium]|nr:biopolymer transporter ExbD [Pseudobdellovibrionaceae bacterium]